MNYVPAQPQALINGAIASDVCVNYSHGAAWSLQDTAASYFPNSVIKLGLPDVEVDLRLLVTGDTNDDMAAKAGLWYDLCYASPQLQLVALGDGFVCPYCGDYNPAGRATCWRCGGRMERQPFVKVEEFPFLVREYSIDMGSLYDIECACISLNMMADAPVYQHHLDMLWQPGGVRLEHLPNDCTLDTEHYLCQFCGSIVVSGKQCPNCGGQRLPWSELVKIDHECLYCGRKTTDGIVCCGCAASLGGQALRSVLQ